MKGGLAAAGLLFAGTICAGELPQAGGAPSPRTISSGAVRLRLRFPGNGERGEPLVSIGDPSAGELLFWQPDGAGKARLGFEETGKGVEFSGPFPAAGGDHAIDVSLGSLWPAPAGFASAAGAGLADLLWAAVDGRTVMIGKRDFRVRGRPAFFGANAIGSPLARAFFSGEVEGIEALDPARARSEGVRPASLFPGKSHSGPLRFRLRLPDDATGRSEPLLVGGEPGAADFLFIRYPDRSHIRLGFDRWGAGGPLSNPIAVEPGGVYELRVSAGFLFPPGRDFHPGDSDRELLPAIVWVEWEGRTVLALWAPGAAVPPDRVTVGANFAGGSSVGPWFSGLIERLEPIEPEAVASAAAGAAIVRARAPGPEWEGYPGPVRMRVVTPARPTPGRGEPLIAAGPTGAADIVFLRYDADGRARFGMDHWGWQLILSEAVSLPPGSEHELLISTGALFPPDGSRLFRERPALAGWKDRVRVDLDGRPVLEARRERFVVRPREITLGLNLTGSSTTETTFAGRVLQADSAPPGSWAGRGSP